MSRLIRLNSGESVPLGEKTAAGESLVHVFDQDSIDAVNAAWAAARPLLVRGEPGTGKSQLAQAAAVALRLPFFPFVADAKTEAQDLKWSYDAVRRLAVAQSMSAYAGLTPELVDERLHERHFVAPGVLWRAFEGHEPEGVRPPHLAEWNPGDGCVVLIDEIDKADSDVPNGLLEALGARQFKVPIRSEPVRCTGTPPLVVLTTNEERSLPDAFLRRCLVLQLAWPDVRTRRTEFVADMVKRGVAHFGKSLTQEVYEEAAEMLVQDRMTVEERGLKPPGLAEYLDLLRAVLGMPASKTPAQWLATLRKFAFRKHPPERTP